LGLAAGGGGGGRRHGLAKCKDTEKVRSMTAVFSPPDFSLLRMPTSVTPQQSKKPANEAVWIGDAMRTRSNRRHFLKQSTVLGAGFWIGGGAATAFSKSANEKLNIGVIGAGGRGASNLQDVSGENVVALCDVNEHNLGKAAEKHPKA